VTFSVVVVMVVVVVVAEAAAAILWCPISSPVNNFLLWYLQSRRELTCGVHKRATIVEKLYARS